MKRPYVHGFDVPGCAYRKPSICDMHGLVVDVVAVCGPVVRDELERLIREQADDMAGKETTPAGDQTGGGNCPDGGGTT